MHQNLIISLIPEGNNFRMNLQASSRWLRLSLCTNKLLLLPWYKQNKRSSGSSLKLFYNYLLKCVLAEHASSSKTAKYGNTVAMWWLVIPFYFTVMNYEGHLFNKLLLKLLYMIANDMCDVQQSFLLHNGHRLYLGRVTWR